MMKYVERIDTNSVKKYHYINNPLSGELEVFSTHQFIGRYSEADFFIKYKGFFGFDKTERSSFKYWFAHWCAFQLTALNLKRWKFKYLFHDFSKPWLKLFCKYKTVQKWHREHNSHHLEYGLKYGWDKVDWEALIIDWECSKLSKIEAQLDAYETMYLELQTKWKPYKNEIQSRFYTKLYEMKL